MRRSAFWGTSVLFCIVTCLFVIKCSDSTDSDIDTDIELDTIVQQEDEISRQVLASLEGEIIFSIESRLYLLNLEFGLPANIIANDISGPAKWSPDGSKIAYIREKVTPETGWSLTIIDKEGTELNDWKFDLSGRDLLEAITWSPDGNIIAVLKSNIVSPSENYVMHYINISSGEITRIALVSGWLEYYNSIAWWPNGNKIAISSSQITQFSFYGNSKYASAIWMFETYDKDPHADSNNLIVIKDSVFIRNLDWSKDGSKLIYSSSSNISFYAIDSAITNNHEIILNDLYDDEKVGLRAPFWSSNNKQIMYSWITRRNNEMKSNGIYVTDINGSYNVKVLDEGTIHDWY